MNVRFFAGTKKEYLSLAKHNPQALYFCADTQELYWGDMCLSDGIRVIATKADLPTLEAAAEGIVYYVAKTGNAYTLLPDRSDWIQTIYAPVRNAEEVDESEVYKTVTTVGAVRDLIKQLRSDIAKDLENIEVPNLENYALKADLAGKANVEHKHTIADIEGYEAPDLGGYALKSEVALKADDVLFSTDKFVTKAVGGFVVGDNLNGVKLADLFAKLLELVNEQPDAPVEPDEPDSIIDNIIINKLAMYSVDDNGNMIAEDFEKLTFDATTAELAPENYGFYQIVENGKVIESGYQNLMSSNDELYYVIALPKEVDYHTMVKLQEWDDEDGWNECQLLQLTSDPDVVAELCDEVGIDISHINTELYTVWAMEDVCTGSKLRFIIEEAN